MTKRATSLLFTLLVFIFNTTMVWGVPLTSKTTFAPQSDVTSSTYMLDEIEIEPPFIRAIRTSYTYTTSLPDNNNSARFNKYQVTSEGAKFGYGATNNDTQKNTFMTVDYENLQTNKQYKLTVTMRLVGNADMEVNVTKNWSNLSTSGCGQSGNNNERVKITDGNCDATFTFTFQPTSPMGSFSFGWNYNDKTNLKYVLVKSVSISGDVEKQVLSSKGFEVCAGETTRLTAVGLTAPVTWEECNQGETTWTTIEEETGITMDVVVTKAKHYRAKKGSDILYTQKTTSSGTVNNIAIRPVICCSKAGDLIPIFTESFDIVSNSTTLDVSGNRAEFKNSNITTYTYSSGAIDNDEYAIVKIPSQGGYWSDSHISGGHTQNGTKDGFYLANCGKDPKIIFTYTIQDDALCTNTVYDFSAWICNVDNISGQAPVNATLAVVGVKDNGTQNEFFNIPTGDLGPGSDWGQYGRSFNSEDCTKFIVTIRNNYQGTATNVLGNDIGVDDIVFSACRPEIQIYSNNQYKPIVVVCNNGITQQLTLDALAAYDLTEFFATPYYLFQTSASETGTWSNVGTASKNESITIDVDPTQYQNGLYYRVWVGATKEAVEASATSGQPGTGCQALTAVSDPIKITYHCDCTASPAPETDDYAACPSTTKLDLNTLITNPSSTGTYYWYTSATGDTPMSATNAQNVDVSTYNSASPTTTYYVSYDQDGTSNTYCESERTAVNVTLYGQAAGLDPTTIANPFATYCRNELPQEGGLSITTQDQNGRPMPDPTMVYTWYVIDDDGNEVTALGTTGDEEIITFDVPADSPANFRMRVVSSSPTLCPKTDEFIYAVIYENTNFTLSAPTEVCAAAPEVTLTLTNMEGTGDLVIKKGTTTLKTETNFSGTGYTYTDNSSHGNATSVTYTVTFGDPDNCGKKATATVTIGTSMDVPLTSNATNNTVCEGTKVTITSSRPENASEYYTWYKTGADGVRTKVAEGNGMRVYSDLEALTAKTIYDVEVTNGACEGDGTITINVDKKPVPTLSVDPAIICLEGTAAVTYTEAATLASPSYVWKDNGTTITGEDDANLTYTGKTEGIHTITLVVTNGTCFADATTQVDVRGAIDFSVSATPNILCQGEGTTLAFDINTTQYPNAIYSWTLNGTSIPQEDPKATSLAITADAAGEFTYIGTVKDVCQASKEVTITVEEGIIASIQDFEICEGDDVKLELETQGDYTYKWSPNNGLSDNTIQKPTASPKQDITYKVEIETKLKTCSATKETKVTVHPKPVITSIEETDVRQITAVADDQTQWPTFRVDDIDNTYENSPVVISGIPIGYHRLYITNEWGCENSDTFEISPIPVIPKKFFSPNGEGDPETEYWTVEGLDAYTSWIVEIFDRYGRRLYEYRTGSFSETGNDPTTWLGWDGNYNGHQMPSDDYWYLITVEEIRKQYSGHFILKR